MKLIYNLISVCIKLDNATKMHQHHI